MESMHTNVVGAKARKLMPMSRLEQDICSSYAEEDDCVLKLSQPSSITILAEFLVLEFSSFAKLLVHHSSFFVIN